jgi:hypothetical protein
MTPNPLEQIQQLIRAGKAHEARQILTKLLYKDSTDPHLWWLFAQVPENKDQLYAILDSLVEMPTNPYTGKARAMLARLPYRPSEEVKKNLPVQRHGSRKSSWAMLAGAGTLVIVLIVVGLGLRSATARFSSAAGPDDMQALPAPNQVAVAASNTPAPSATPRSAPTSVPTSQPTLQSTRKRQATTLPPTLTSTVVTPDLAVVLPDLNRAFVNRTTTLFNLVDGVTGVLDVGNGLSSKALGTIADHENQIRTLRNEMILMNSGSVPTEVRVKIIAPAQTAFTAYADSALQWIVFQIQARQLVATESVSDNTTSTELLQEQSTKSAQQATAVKANRKALQTALDNYSMFTAETVLKAHASGKAVVLTGTTSQQLRMAGGKYRVSFRLEAAPNQNQVALWLVPEDETVRKVSILDPQKPITSGTTTLDLKEGAFTMEALGSSWWVVVLDPQ